MRYHLKIFGCQMNYSDAERIATILERYKFRPAASADEADLVVFVTCGVRQSAEDRVYGQINNVKKKYSDKKIILTGCLAHRRDVQRRLKDKVNLFVTIKDFPKEIKSLIFGNPDKVRHWGIPTTVLSGGKGRTLIPQKPSFEKKDYLKIFPKYTNTYTAYVLIMTGCDNFCTYCVVPYARGREYSRPAEDILKEVNSLVKKGYKEIILLGQNVNSYRSKINSKISDKISFSGLLKIIDSIPGDFWLTFLTSHPKDMSDELIETIAKSKKICEYISLPVQSGDNGILHRMNRNYTIEHYKKLIKKIRLSFSRPGLEKRKRPGLEGIKIAISTDIIVGFPGETKKQFENTAKLMREVKFDMAYISQYSPRPETAALKMKDNVARKEKARREKVLTKILEKTALENNNKYIGKIVDVLTDKRFDLGEFRELRSRKEKVEPWERAKYLAHTRTQKKVIFPSNKKIPIGSFVNVKIVNAKAFGLEGKIYE